MTGASAHRLRLCLPLLAIWAAASALAQDPVTADGATDDPEEEVLDLIDDDEASESAAELIASLRENPLDLNQAGREELLLIPGLAEDDADAILKLRESRGVFRSLEELLLLPRGRYLLARVRPYVVVRRGRRGSAAPRRPVVKISSRVSLSSAAVSGPPTNDMLGGKSRTLSRATVTLSDQVRVGSLYEKDAGERTRDGFVSGYVSLHGIGPIEQLVIGDFASGAGQGLVLWRTTDFGRSGDIARGGRKSGSRLQPYTQTDEAHYLRGGALLLKGALFHAPVRCMLLLSRTSLGANVNEDGEVTSLYTAGLFRTARELEKAGAVHESLAGARLETTIRNRGMIGLTYYQTRFDRTINPSSGFGFSGEICRARGADFSLALGPGWLFGEAARVEDAGTAWILGGMLQVDSTLKISLSFRDYGTDFLNPHARGFGMQSSTSNERGTYVGWSLRVSDAFSVRGYADHCNVPGSSYSSLMPRSSTDLLWGIAFSPPRGAYISLSMRIRKQEAMESERQSDRRRLSMLITRRLDLSERFGTRTRIEGAWFNVSGREGAGNGDPRSDGTGGSNGLMGSQTFRYRDGRIECEYGWAIFDADSYDARLYDVEGNLRGSMISPALHGRGTRWHLLACWSWSGFRVAGKYAVTDVEKQEAVREGALQLELGF